MQLFFKVTKGTIIYRGHEYAQGAEFPANTKEMEEFRAQGVVERVTPHIVYVRSNKDRRVHTMHKGDRLITMSRNNLFFTRKDYTFVSKFRELFPQFTGRQIKMMPKKQLIDMIVEKRGF